MTINRAPGPAGTLLLSILLAACAAPGASPPMSPDQPSSPDGSPSPAPSQGGETAMPAAPAGIPEPIWAAVLDDLSRRIGEPVADPTVVSVSAQTWNDGSLGCPKPGEFYTQALVDGHQIVLEVDDQQFDYRTASGPSVRLCEDGAPIEGGG